MNNTSVETRQQRRFKSRQEKKGPMKPQKNAFHRAMKMFKERYDALQAAMAMGPIAAKLAMGPIAARLALMALADRLGQYKSRGKGRGGISPAHNIQAQRSRYRPHQGAREMERRRVGGFAFRRYVETRYGDPVLK